MTQMGMLRIGVGGVCFFLIFVVSCFVFPFGKLLLLSKNINFTFLVF